MSTQANDPRQPSAAKPYVAPAVSPQDLPVDYSGFIAVVFGIAGVMFRVFLFLFEHWYGNYGDLTFHSLGLFVLVWFEQYKLSSWLAIIFCAQSLVNMRNMENDLKQISMAMMWVFLASRSLFLYSFIQKFRIGFVAYTWFVWSLIDILLSLKFKFRWNGD